MASSTYSRDEIVSVITNYYQFFVTLPYVDPSALRLAPQGGWPDINADELRKRGKTEEVIALLRLLPYLEHEDTRTAWTIDFGCVSIQYHKDVCYNGIIDDVQDIPGHVIPIAEMADRDGPYLLLDTHTGCITTYNIMEHNFEDNWEEYDNLPEKQKWKTFPTAPAREFFGRWIRLYERLIRMVAPTTDSSHGDRGQYFGRADNAFKEDEMLELDSDDDDSNTGDEDEETTEVHATYKRHGWSSQRWDRDACKSELATYLNDRAAEDFKQYLGTHHS